MLDEHRYLDRRQIQALFFRGPRSCQYRLRWLVDRGLVMSWRVAIRPGRICSASIFLLSRRGAATLTDWSGDDPRPVVRRAEHALERRAHLVHQLQANQFFVDLAVAAAGRRSGGLYHWVGEHGIEAAYAEGDERAPIPDGWGRLLLADRELFLHLEWDRGTEQVRRLQGKVGAYLRYFGGRVHATANHVLFVAPTSQRERVIAKVLRDAVDSDRIACRLWTTTAQRLAEDGALGAVWSDGRLQGRVRMDEMPGVERSTRSVEDAIAKPEWWVRRPGGAAGS